MLSNRFFGLGYDESHVAVWSNNTQGSSPCVWDRAQGWWAVALIDLLDYVPLSQTALRKDILTYIQELAPALVKAADPATGVWWMVLSSPGAAGNYFESSASSMFTFFLLKVRLFVAHGMLIFAQTVRTGDAIGLYPDKCLLASREEGVSVYLEELDCGKSRQNAQHDADRLCR